MGIFSSDEKEIISKANGDSITESRLFEKSARVLKRLESDPIVEYLKEGEQPHYLFSGPSTGLTVTTPDGEYSISPDGPYHTFLVVTDQGLLFLAGQNNGDESVSLSFDELRNARLMTSPTKFKLRFGTEAGMCVFHSNKKMDEAEANEATEYIQSRIPEDSSTVDMPSSLQEKLAMRAENDSSGQQSQQMNRYIAANAGSTVTSDRISTISELLSEDDEVVHILRVPLLYHGPEADEKSMSTKHTKTGTAAFTKEKVVIKIPHQLADDQFIIRYDNIESVSYNMEGMTASRGFEITTAGEKYRLGVHYKIEDREVREILNWLDERVAATTTVAATPDSSQSSRDRLKELEALRDEDLISTEEFEEKREEILEDL